MTGSRQTARPALVQEVSIKGHVPQDHLLRSIARFVDLGSIHAHPAGFYSHTGRLSVDPERLIRRLLIGRRLGTRSERRRCEEVHLNLACCRLCRLDPHPEPRIAASAQTLRNWPGSVLHRSNRAKPDRKGERTGFGTAIPAFANVGLPRKQRGFAIRCKAHQHPWWISECGV